MDPLADVLDLSRVRGALLANVRAHAPWGLGLPSSAGASFHAVTSGTAWLRVDGAEPMQLQPGDLLLFPTGIGHRLSSDVDGVCLPFDRRMKEEVMTPDGDLILGRAPAATTTFVCAGYEYDLEVAEPLMRVLPPVMHIPASPDRGRDIAAVVQLLAAEVGARNAGARSAIARLIDLLLIAAIRHWSQTGLDRSGASWLTALHDPLLANVLGVIHARPEEAWTLELLARQVHVSRATLARRFMDAVGEPPLAYLARWRMHVAAQRLKFTDDPVATIAGDVGYSSEYAFSRAFSRHRGHPPGRYRRLARAA
jgi:AraC-like DNA-binding protein